MENRLIYDSPATKLFEAVDARKSMRTDNSSKKLLDIIEKRIRTTMIGAIDKIEKKFGHWWGNQKEDESTLTENELRILDMFETCRSEILDLGNDQIRRIRKELFGFDVNIKSYQRRLKDVE